MEAQSCFECGKPSAHAHHVVPKTKGGTRTLPLCVECHSKVHGRQLVHSELIRHGQAVARANGVKWGGSTKGRRISVSQEQVEAVKRYHADGMKTARIARAVGLSRPTVYRLLGE